MLAFDFSGFLTHQEGVHYILFFLNNVNARRACLNVWAEMQELKLNHRHVVKAFEVALHQTKHTH